MKSTLASVAALLVASVQAAAVPVLEPRIDGCPAEAPWPMGNPDTYWYPVCCAYVLGDVSIDSLISGLALVLHSREW